MLISSEATIARIEDSVQRDRLLVILMTLKNTSHKAASDVTSQCN